MACNRYCFRNQFRWLEFIARKIQLQTDLKKSNESDGFTRCGGRQSLKKSFPT